MGRSKVARPSFPSILSAVVAAGGSAVVLVFFLFVDLGGTIEGTAGPAALVVTAIWAGPLWIYARGVRTTAASVAGGAVLLATTVAFLVSVFRDTHSTAAIGLVTVPALTYPLAVAVLAVDRLLSARREGGAALRPFGRRLLAVGLCFVVVMASVSALASIASLFDPVARGDMGGSLAFTVVSGMAATGGALAIKRLWQPGRAGESARLRSLGSQSGQR